MEAAGVNRAQAQAAEAGVTEQARLVRWRWRQLGKAIDRLFHWGRHLVGLLILLAVAAGIWFGVPRLLVLLFPLPYADVVGKYSEEYRIDPFLVVAIMRVESSFDPQAHSHQGALGLMQVMPSTAQEVASGVDGLDLSDPEKDLLRPEINVRIGIMYLDDLRRQFGDDWPVILAAYNGGRGRVDRWLKEGQWDGRLETLGSLPYAETRRYVQKVLRMQAWYHRVYRNRWPKQATAKGVGYVSSSAVHPLRMAG